MEMECPKCKNEMKLIAGKQNPRKAHCCGSDGKSWAGASLTYRDYYFCTECNRACIARINLRVECENSYNELKSWRV